MAQIRGHLVTPGKTNDWHPISLEELGGGEYALKAVIVEGSTLVVAKHYNGNAALTDTNVPFAGTTKSILVTNGHSTATLQVSFDGGVNHYDIAAGGSLSILAAQTSIDLKATIVGTAYQILTTE